METLQNFDDCYGVQNIIGRKKEGNKARIKPPSSILFYPMPPTVLDKIVMIMSLLVGLAAFQRCGQTLPAQRNYSPVRAMNFLLVTRDNVIV